MHNDDPELWIDKLEAQLLAFAEGLTRLDAHTARVMENLCVENMRLEQRVKALEEQMTDFRAVERIAQEAYLRTTPQAQDGLIEVIDVVTAAPKDQRGTKT